MSNLDVEMAEVIVNLEKENASLKNELIKECQEHQEAMQIADKRIKDWKSNLQTMLSWAIMAPVPFLSFQTK